ncbi:MAG: hypothetical protein ABH986_04685 [archaeon]
MILFYLPLSFVQSQIYADSAITNNVLSIDTEKKVKSQFHLVIKPTGIFSTGVEYDMNFNYIRRLKDINLEDYPYYGIWVYPSEGLSNISNVECITVLDNKKRECDLKVNYESESQDNFPQSRTPIEIKVLEDYDYINLKFECSTCSYSNVNLDLINSNFYKIFVDFNLQNNIIDGVEVSGMNEYINPKLFGRTHNEVSFQLQEKDVNRTYIPIYLIVRNKIFQALETLIISIIGGLIVALLLPLKFNANNP